MCCMFRICINYACGTFCLVQVFDANNVVNGPKYEIIYFFAQHLNVICYIVICLPTCDTSSDLVPWKYFHIIVCSIIGWKVLQTKNIVILFCNLTILPCLHSSEVEDADFKPPEAELDEYHPKATRTLFVGNLEKDIGSEELREIFNAYGEILVSCCSLLIKDMNDYSKNLKLNVILYLGNVFYVQLCDLLCLYCDKLKY